MVHNEQPAEYIPFEIVREEERRGVVFPSRWKFAAFAALGVMALIGIATLGILVIVFGLLIAIPLMTLRGFIAPMFRK